MSLLYSQADVLKWPSGGGNTDALSGSPNINAEFGQGEPIFLLRVFGNVSHSSAGGGIDTIVTRKSPYGSTLDRKLFTLTAVSVDHPINWRLLEEAHLHEIGGAETLGITGTSSENPMNWDIEVWAIRVRDTQYGRQGGFRV